MSAPDPAPSRTDPPAPPWGLGEVAIAVVATLFVSQILVSIVFALAGVSDVDDASLGVLALGTASLWVGMVGAVVLVLRARRADPRSSLGLAVRPLDVPIGIVLGVACQLVLVPVVSTPWARFLGESLDDLKGPACRLADKADDPFGVVLLTLVTVVGAPIVEELFFRGFVQRGVVGFMAGRFGAAGLSPAVGRWVGLTLTAALFALVHFQRLQFLALLAFGLVLGVLADRTGRLGPGIVTHMAFNATTVVTLLALSGSIDDTCRDVLSTVGLPALGLGG
ncbi:MAG: CPBP family intramembrane metalloprotease [Acidimicrobiales bacterium]|nr:CPBP family intramembrane metalloprotease [Acidimicrobiales bacterium]